MGSCLRWASEQIVGVCHPTKASGDAPPRRASVRRLTMAHFNRFVHHLSSEPEVIDPAGEKISIFSGQLRTFIVFGEVRKREERVYRKIEEPYNMLGKRGGLAPDATHRGSKNLFFTG